MMQQEKLHSIVKHGYAAALDTCFNERQMYIRGFLDGMRFGKFGIKPKSHLNKSLNKINSKHNGTICNDK